MSPYYERDGIVIYLGDCREVLPTLQRGSADLLVTDPPYGVNYRSNVRAISFELMAGDDDNGWVREALALAASRLKERRHAYVFGPDILPDVLTAKASLIWDKVAQGSGDLSCAWAPSHEPITFAVYYSSEAERKAGRGQLAARLRGGSVLRYPRPCGRGVKRHPTEKPVSLLRRLIESSSFPGDCVLDPFLGSGSTLVAAIAEGRTGVGIELDERYAAIAAERVDTALDGMRELAGMLT